MGPDHIYAISAATSGGYAYLTTYNSNVNPPASYPVLPSPVPTATCTAQTPFTITATGAPQGANTNETVYLIRHAEAHPASGWDDGNYIGAGQWRALDLPYALQGRLNPSPTQVYSIDPAQVYPGAVAVPGNSNFSYVRPSLTVEPYAIANNLPYYLVSGFELFATDSPGLTSNFFFTGGKFSNQTVLVAWEHGHYPPIIDALLATYGNPSQTTAPAWPSDDYDTIWTVTLDSQGNVTVSNTQCEGIDSSKLPAAPPQF